MFLNAVIFQLHSVQIFDLHIEGGLYADVFENGVLISIFGPEREEVTGEWRRIHKEELYGLYSSPNINRVTK